MVDKYKEMVLEGNGSHHNLRFEYMRYTARTLTKDNCVVCSQGRANLFMWPIPYLSDNWTVEFNKSLMKELFSMRFGGKTMQERVTSVDIPQA